MSSKKKLNTKLRKHICEVFSRGHLSKADLGRKYGVSTRTIGRIIEEFPEISDKKEYNRKFKVGDLIIGNSENYYAYTSGGVVCEVVEDSFDMLDEYINVKIIKDNSISGNPNPSTVFPVRTEYFDLYVEEKKDDRKFKVGDIIIGNSKNDYPITHEKAICEVVEDSLGLLDGKINVKVVGECPVVYQVSPEYFDLYVEESEEESEPNAHKFSVGDLLVVKDIFEEDLQNLVDLYPHVDKKILKDEYNLAKNTVLVVKDITESLYKLSVFFNDNEVNNSHYTINENFEDDVVNVHNLYQKAGNIENLPSEYLEEEEIEKVLVEETRLQPTYTITSNTVMFNYKGRSETINKSHPNFKEVVDKIISEDFEEVLKLIDIKTAILEYSEGLLEIEGDSVTYSGYEINNSLTEKIIAYMKDGEKDSFKPFVSFLNKVMKNPSLQTRNRVMDFVAAEDIEITSEGQVIAYKNVSDDFAPSRAGEWYKGSDDLWNYDKSSYYINTVGSVCEMPRTEVDDEENNTCSTGLHVCSLEYLRSCWGFSGKTVKVSVEPEDIVAIPPDYNNSKARTCKYTVIEDVTGIF